MVDRTSATSPFGADPWVVVLEDRDRRRAEDAVFVLRALGIEHVLSRLDGAWQLSVPAASARRAGAELAAYRAELRAEPVEAPRPLDVRGNGWTGVGVYATVLLAAAIAANQDLLGVDWLGAGRLDVDRVLSGEWWRTVTALCLHVDTAHLAGNLAFGGFFGLYAGRYLGGGVAWLAIVAGGALGNALNALIQPAGHLAIGASTAVFAALGLLGAYTWRRGQLARAGWKTRAAPVTAAIGLLGFMGTGGGQGGNVDIIAHLTGFVAGFTLGLVLARIELPRGPRVQVAAAATAAAVVAGAWSWAAAS